MCFEKCCSGCCANNSESLGSAACCHAWSHSWLKHCLTSWLGAGAGLAIFCNFSVLESDGKVLLNGIWNSVCKNWGQGDDTPQLGKISELLLS